MKNNVTKPGGLHTDSDFVSQPENTTSYALNTVNETNDGDIAERSNEESNEQCYTLTENYTLLSDVYVGEQRKLIFSVANDESSSEIGIVDRECNYSVLVNADFGFKLTHQIDATYRLRRGCEHTVYWTDPKPRIININDLDSYKDSLGNWNINQFNLLKTYNKIPIFSTIVVGEEGNIPPGSINFAVQYLDEDFNPTEFIRSSETIKIYNDSISKSFNEIHGSTNRKSDYQDFGNTNKSVTVRMSNLDSSYPFYRLAIITSDGGTGQITSVVYSNEIPTELPVYTYTGEGVTIGSVEEIQQFSTIIDSAEHIEQIQGKLILSNVKMKQVNYCNLQKYASRIKADLVFREVVLNDITSISNPKSPTASVDGVGHMPGEIESYGIVYVFDDGQITPSYHIPGKATTYPSLMSDDNKCTDAFYTDDSNCQDMWGVDSEGNKLRNTVVRHHRFPLRSEVNKPLIKSTNNFEQTVEVNVVSIKIDGEFTTTEPIDVNIAYTVDGVSSTYTETINPEFHKLPMEVKIYESTKDVVVETIYENQILVQGESASGLTYEELRTVEVKKISSKQFVAEIFGLDFSNIVMPALEDTNGNKIVGYYIVRNERTEDQKTILDNGILTPLMEEPYYTAAAHLVPNNAENIKQDAFALIHPEHKFLGKEYKNTTSIIQQGQYVSGKITLSGVLTQDVMVGTSYDPEVAKRKENDGDGFSLLTLSRDVEMIYRNKAVDYVSGDNLDEIFYLDALNSKAITDSDDSRKEIFNVSCDNKIGVVTSKIKKPFESGTIPYVTLKRELANPYANFRYLPYYMASKNVNNFNEGNASERTTIFAGDAYITPMRYANSFYHDILLRRRATKSGLFNIILGGLAVIAGAVIAIASGGTALAAAAMVAGFGISQISAGIKKEQIGKVYGQLYDAGLKDCISDDDTKKYFSSGNPGDDEIQWMGEALTNIWIESSVNMSLRQGTTANIPDFLDAPATVSEQLNTVINDVPKTILDSYFLEKLTVLDTEAGNGRLYQGFSNAEFYELNKDYLRRNKEKIYNHLGIEYDCCSDCNEVFTQRNHYSETSFDEELTDNFRTFLPNNYRDIEGEKGEITNTFKIQNHFYIHTAEALWHLPENFQERVTGDIVSFLGTGEFFNIPPRKIVDDDDSSAGTRHKWGATKTKHGVLFPSIDDRVWYLFNGNQLQPISSVGNNTWFNNNMSFKAEEDYFKANKEQYPYSNNPSSKFGTGFISTYDDIKNRFIITKKDFKLNENLGTNYRLCESGGELTIFRNFSNIVSQNLALGYEYVGIENCRLTFKKTTLDLITEQREVVTSIPSSTDLHFMLDTSGSFGQATGPELTQIRNAAQAWADQFKNDNPDWEGNVYFYNDSTERWLRYIERIAQDTYAGQNLAEKDILLVSFCNESTPYGNGEGITGTIQAPTQAYLDDYAAFKQIHGLYNSFIGIHYPIVFNSGVYSNSGKGLVQQSLAAIKGTSYTTSDLQQIQRNAAFNDADWSFLQSSLKGNNPYPDDGLENYGWTGKFNRNNIGGKIIDAATFANDINELIANISTTELVDFEVKVPKTVYNYIKGEPITEEDFILADCSWTMSYSLKQNTWVSWHSYTPNYYFRMNDKFYSWKYGDNSIWRHNRKNHYQTFYGTLYPHIIEYVSKSSPLQNMIKDSIMLHSTAKLYINGYDDYVTKRYITFNKALFYNSRQISGMLNMVVTPENADYMEQRTIDSPGNIMIDNNEGVWYVNGFRDMRTTQELPMFKKGILDIKDEYFTDKVVNEEVIDQNKNWFEQESFRDKYLVVRLIFDTFDSIKLVTNYSVENEDPSIR